MASSYKQADLTFVARWLRLVKDKAGYTTKIHEIDFSEGLLKTLYYETDIGSIPRGAEIDDTPPKYKDNPNWSKHIPGCYWCLRDRTHFQGICCSKDCIYYLHEWCVERVELFQERIFCKRPGCDRSPPQRDYSCCGRTHHSEYTELYKWVGREQLNGVTKKGPGWYNKEVSFNTNKHPAQYNPFTCTTSITKSATMDLATELKSSLIFYTDIGPIPRSYNKSEHFVSQHSYCVNWRADITGCYQCGRPVTERCEYLCSQKCYFIFNEWCRQKVVDGIKKEFCEYPGCGNEPQNGYSTCSREHLEKRNNYLVSNECYQLLKQGPHWYKSTEDSSSGTMSTTSHQDQTHSSPDHSQNPTHPQTLSYLFPRVLTEWMYKESDIGPIPRTLIQTHYIGDKNRPTASNWNTFIPGCYWCCGGSTLHIHGIACSVQCFFLFNEWCHKKYTSATFKQICKSLHCGTSVSFKKDSCYMHTTKYSSYTIKFGYLLKTSDFALGPKWYSNESVKHIDFYNREDPFYEFTNFFPCPSLKIDGKQWKTTEHYFQSQKFIGTPHVECVRGMNTPRETFEYTRRSSTQKWIRPDWALVKERIMLKALEAKFSQNDGLAQLLIRTGDLILYEHTRNDKFWGDGGDRRGQNKLGMLLTQVRFDLQRKSPFLPAMLEHIDLNMSQSESPACQISSSVGSVGDTIRTVLRCASVTGAVSTCGVPGTGTEAPGGKSTCGVPHGGSSLKGISNSDTDDYVIINKPDYSEVMFNNYEEHKTQTPLTNASAGSSINNNNTPSQTGCRSTNDTPHRSHSGNPYYTPSTNAAPIGPNYPPKSSERNSTNTHNGNVRNIVLGIEKGYSSPKNEVGTNTITEPVDNLCSKNYESYKTSFQGGGSAPITTNASLPSLHMELKLKPIDPSWRN